MEQILIVEDDPALGRGLVLALEGTERACTLAPDCAVFVGHGKHNELHDPEEAVDAYQRANEPKALYWVDGKHNEWMFDGDPKLEGLCSAMNDFFRAHI